MMLRSTSALMRWTRSMLRPRPKAVGSTIVLIPPSRSRVSLAIASATRSSSSQ